VVGAHDPMRRTAVAAPRSLYLNSGRALVSENGSSPLLRSLVETFAQVRDRERSDWLGESLVDYYAMVVLHRAGGLSDDRYRVLQRRLHAEAEGVTTLRGDQASPAQVARGVLLLQALDKEIRVYSHGKRSLDDVTRALMRLPSVSTEEFVQLSEQVLERGSSVLEAPVLR
jgi:predicted metalloprotease with PDZ domain